MVMADGPVVHSSAVGAGICPQARTSGVLVRYSVNLLCVLASASIGGYIGYNL